MAPAQPPVTPPTPQKPSTPNSPKIPPGLEIADKRQRMWLAWWLSPPHLFRNFKKFYDRGGRVYSNSTNDIRTRLKTAIKRKLGK